MPTETQRFQTLLKNRISNFVQGQNLDAAVSVEIEWNALLRIVGNATLERYSPRTDIAVGPFATGDLRLGHEYDRIMERLGNKIDLLLNFYRENASGSNILVPDSWREINSVNENARCLLAIEVEKSGTMKHRLGDIVNAAALGRVGIVVGWDERIVKSFLRIGKYFGFLRTKGKPSFKTENLIIVTREQIKRGFP